MTGTSFGRRRLLSGAGALGLGSLGLGRPALAAEQMDLKFPGGVSQRAVTTAFPGKGRMLLQRNRPPLLETPFEVFDRGLYTPNDQFFVRWHWAVIPTQVDVASFRLTVRGHVNRPLSLSLDEIIGMPPVELAAVNQCSGNSRGFFTPRVPGAQWGNGAMGNARWAGVRLRDVLDRAGVKPGAVAVRFTPLDQPVVAEAPGFSKSIAIDHARDGEVMLAYLMNGEQLPLLNGFPLRVVVPGWYSTYWVKSLVDIEVLDTADDAYWSKTAYRIPDTPLANVRPGQSGFPTVPINRMGPRSFITNLASGATVRAGQEVGLRGIAFGGAKGVRQVDLSTDGGRNWRPAQLGVDEGQYGFRRWEARLTPPAAGEWAVQVRCTDTDGTAQPGEANWNPNGFMRNVIESLSLTAS
jgi:DMSO/TMAO reductase YedYZ molybdopterin-dependent catalytic subunit